MNSPPESPSLAELQTRFAAMLRRGDTPPTDDCAGLAACIVDDGIEPAARMQVYRNNVHAMFTGALERTYPVLRQRVGAGFFAQLAADYRREHPSRNGDLHWIGRHFPQWIGTRMAGTDYAWLADLARLEWACEEALVAARLPDVPADALANLSHDELPGARFSLQPGLRTLSSPFPVWSVWQANQPAAPGQAVDLSGGPEHVAVAPDPAGLVLHSLPADRHRFVQQLAAGSSLEDALDAAGLPVEQLAATLAWLFGAGLVVKVERPGESSRDGDPA